MKWERTGNIKFTSISALGGKLAALLLFFAFIRVIVVDVYW